MALPMITISSSVIHHLLTSFHEHGHGTTRGHGDVDTPLILACPSGGFWSLMCPMHVLCDTNAGTSFFGVCASHHLFVLEWLVSYYM